MGAVQNTPLQVAYDISTDPEITLGVAPSPGTLSIVQDAAAAVDPLLEIQDNTRTSDYLRIGVTEQDIGVADNQATVVGQPQVRVQDAANTLQFWPTDRTFTSSPGSLMTGRVGGLYIHDYPSVSFAALNLQFTMQHNQAGFIFNHGLIFNHGITYRNELNVNNAYGPLQGFIDQPTVQVNRTSAGVVTMGLFRSFLSQPRFSRTSTNGTLAVTSVGQFQAFGGVSVGAAVTTWTRVQLGPFVAPTTGTITNYRAIDIVNETQPTTIITAIRMAIAAAGGGTRRNLEIIGDAISTVAGDLHMNNGVPLVLGSVGSSRVEVLRSSAGVMRSINVGGANNEGVDLNLDAVANVAEWSSSTGAGFKWSPTGAADAAASLVLGDGLDPDGTANWWLAWAPGARTVNLVGDWFDILFSPGANVDLAGNAMGTVATVEFVEPGITLSGGSVVTAVTVFIANAPTEGTTDNNALRVGSGLTSLDDLEIRTGARVDFNTGVALGGGAGATLGTIGGAGPTAAAQAQWLEVDIAGVAHWIAVWT